MSILARSKQFSSNLNPKINILEFFIIALVLAYLFNYYYLQTSAYRDFIVSTDIIWITFASSLILFGIALGARFILNLVSNLVLSEAEATFKRNKEVYDIFTLIWLNLSILMIFFSYSLMEISRPTQRIDSQNDALVIYGLSGFLGLMFYFFHKEVNAFAKRVTLIGMILVSIGLSLLTYESKIDFITNLPLTVSFITFNSIFFISIIGYSISKFISKIRQRKAPLIAQQFIPSTDTNIQPSPAQNIFPKYKQPETKPTIVQQIPTQQPQIQNNFPAYRPAEVQPQQVIYEPAVVPKQENPITPEFEFDQSPIQVNLNTKDIRIINEEKTEGSFEKDILESYQITPSNNSIEDRLESRTNSNTENSIYKSNGISISLGDLK